MAKNTNVLKSRGLDAVLEVKISTESLRSVQEFCKAEKQKGDDEKFSDPLNPHVQHGRAYILCQLRGGQCLPNVSYFPIQHFSQSALLFLCKSLCPSWCWCFGNKAICRRNLHHHSVCLSRCSPYGLTTHYNALNPILERIVVYHIEQNKSCAKRLRPKNIVYKLNKAKAKIMTKITVNILIIKVMLRVRCTITL